MALSWFLKHSLQLPWNRGSVSRYDASEDRLGGNCLVHNQRMRIQKFNVQFCQVLTDIQRIIQIAILSSIFFHMQSQDGTAVGKTPYWVPQTQCFVTVLIAPGKRQGFGRSFTSMLLYSLTWQYLQGLCLHHTFEEGCRS